MTVIYRVYSNQGTGGPVDYSTPVATASAPTYDAGPLGVSTDNTFVVHAYDPATGFEQPGSEAGVRVIVGPGGADVSGLPNAPLSLTLSPAPSGGARVSWAYTPARPWGRPTGFQVFLNAGTNAGYSATAATVPYIPGRVGYSCTLPGPYSLATYTAAVRSFNAVGSEGNSDTVTAPLGLPAPYAMEPVQVTFGPPGH